MNEKFSSIDGVLFTKDKSRLISYAKDKIQSVYSIPEGVTSLGNGCFRVCRSLTSITIPEGVTSLGDECFSFCDSLTSITIPEGVTSLGDECFSNCSSLTSITIPEGVTSLGNRCFKSCGSLTSINLPSTLTSLGDSCFSYCRSLTSLTALGTTAPRLSRDVFGESSSSYTGRKTYNTGENTLYVPSGATGYDTGLWLDPLQNAEKCGFTLSATL